MVATVFELKSSAMAVSYFERDGYYARNDPEHRQASFWHGGAAKDLGLRAHVRPSRFEEVLSGWVPGTDIRLGRMREGEHEHRPGWDITLSAPKSVSLEALVIGDRRVIRAHDEAVRATLDWVEAELLQTRGWDPATRRRSRVKADGMAVAGFRHLTSRDRDPQLHTHCVLANMTRTAAGEWRNVEPTKIRRSEKLIGAYYRNELARRLQALGMAATPRLIGRVPGFELAGYDRSLLEAFSGRRREILAYIDKHGLAYTPENAQMATLRTRRHKKDIGLAELVPAWRDRARALGLSREKAGIAPPRPVDPLTGERVAVPRVPPPDLPANTIRSMKRAPALPRLPRDGAEGLSNVSWGRARPSAPAELSPEAEVGVLEAVARAVAHVAERRTAIPEAEIRAVALGHAPGRYTIGEIDAAIDRLARTGDLIEVERRGMDRAFVTQWAVKAERRVLASMRAGRGKGATLADRETVERRLDGSRLTKGQKEAVRTVLLADDLVVGVQGHAGSGKTAMLREVRELLGNTRIQGLAPSAAAARVLAREAGIPSRTLQYFLARFGDLTDPGALARAREEYAGSVLAVDEASMIDTMRMADLLRIADRLGVARVALVGDTAQLRAVDAGQPFRLLQKAGMKTAAMTEALRQRDPELLAAVTRAREGEPGAAIEGLGERVREAPREELGYEAASHWLALPPEERADTLLLAPTHAIRRQANEAVREGLETEGTLHGRVLEIDRLVDRRLTRAQASDIGNYQPGDLAAFHRDHYGCRRDDVCTVTGIEDGMVILAHPDGKERRFRPSGNAAWYLRICDTERIELRAGDRIRWTRNRKAPPSRFGHPRAPDLVNGGEAEIVDIDYKRVRFRDADGREFNLALTDPQLRHLDHAYCSTVHSAQGRTARAAIAVLDAGGAADRELFHVELSRVSDEFLLLTDDREALVALLEARPGTKDGALEALGVDPAEIPAVDPEVFAALVRDWRALRQEAEETKTIPFFLPGYREVMVRAVALSEIENLPADMRRLVDTMLAEHEAHHARDREVKALTRKIQENWRRWPELGWAARGRGCAVGELPGYAAWREEGTVLLEEGRRLAEAGADPRAGDAARHLHAMPGGLAGLESAARALERTRRLDDTRQLEPERRMLRGEAAGLLDERRELEERARRAHRSGFAPPTELEEYADWSARAGAVVERWRAMGGGTPTPQPGGDPRRDEAEDVVAQILRLEDLRGHDEAWARWFAMRLSIVEEARARNTIPYYVEGWEAFADRARALAKRPGLPEAAAEAANGVLEYDGDRREERSTVEGFFEGAEEHRRWWDARQEEQARRARRNPDVPITDLPGYRPLSGFPGKLRRTGKKILGNEKVYGPHLDRIPDSRETLASALERLKKHRLLDRFVSAMGRIEETKRGALDRGIPPVDDEGYGKSIARAERLANEDGLDEAARRRLRAALEEHAALATEWLEIERLFREAEELDERYRELDERAVREDVPRSLLSEWPAWRERNLRFEKDARWVLGDERLHEYRQLRPEMLDRIEEGLRLAREREAIPDLEAGRIAEMAGAEMARLRDPGAGQAYTTPWWGREPLLAGDRIGLRLSEDGPEREAVVRRPGWTGGCVPGDELELEWIGPTPGRDPKKPVERMSALDLAGLGVHRAAWGDERVREAERARQFPAPPAGFPFPSGKNIAVGDRLWRTEVAGPDPAARETGRTTLPTVVWIELQAISITAGETEAEDRCRLRERWRSDGEPCREIDLAFDEIAAFAGWRAFADDDDERWSEANAQKIELDRRRAIMLQHGLHQSIKQP